MRSIFTLAFLIAGVQLSFANLIPVGAVRLSGQGLGAVNTVLTFTSPGSTSIESGCAGAGVGGALVTGAGACPAGFAGGNEQAINNTYSASSIGLKNFADLQVIFNPVEPQNAAGQSLTIDDLALTLWNPTNGTLVATYRIAAPYFIANAEPGTGNAGFGFKLDAAQANAANLVLDAVPTLFLGIASNASDATGGHETISIRTTGSTPRGVPEVPEPKTATLGLCGVALILFGHFAKRPNRN
jgi:hypothetical protein